MSNFYAGKNSDFIASKRLSEKIRASDFVGSCRVSSKQRHNCNNEIVYDSMLPKIDDLLMVDDVKLAYLPHLGNHMGVGTYVMSDDNITWRDNNQNPATWPHISSFSSPIFPFQEKYESLIRQKNRPQKYKSYDWNGREKLVTGISFELLSDTEKRSGGNLELPHRRKILLDQLPYTTWSDEGGENIPGFGPIKSTGISKLPNSGKFSTSDPRWSFYNYPEDWDWNFSSDPKGADSFFESVSPFYTHNNLLPPTQDETYKFFFGFGDNKEIYWAGNNLRHSYVECPTFRFKNSETFLSGNFSYHSGSVEDSGGLDVVIGVNVRGWRYGVFDIKPRGVGCIFRRGSFGQFRDMLEQRPFTVFYDMENQQVLTGPVQVKWMQFVSSSISDIFPVGSFIEASPFFLDTYNKNKFARESSPFFEI